MRVGEDQRVLKHSLDVADESTYLYGKLRMYHRLLYWRSINEKGFKAHHTNLHSKRNFHKSEIYLIEQVTFLCFNSLFKD